MGYSSRSWPFQANSNSLQSEEQEQAQGKQQRKQRQYGTVEHGGVQQLALLHKLNQPAQE